MASVPLTLVDSDAENLAIVTSPGATVRGQVIFSPYGPASSLNANATTWTSPAAASAGVPNQASTPASDSAPWNRFLSTHRGELLLERHDERLTDRRLDVATGANSGAQKVGELLHNLLHDPGHGRLTRRDRWQFLRLNVMT
jgi:hypothetical protein